MSNIIRHPRYRLAVETEEWYQNALDDGAGMSAIELVFRHDVLNGFLSLATFLLITSSVLTIVIDESIEHGASIPVITDWYWDLEDALLDEPMGPWDGTYEGIAIPEGEIEEQEGMTFAFQTLPNGDILACGGGEVKMRIYGERVSGTFFDEDGWGYQLTATINGTGHINNGTASGLDNNGSWSGIYYSGNDWDGDAYGTWVDEYGCRGTWRVYSLSSFTKCTSLSNATTNSTVVGTNETNSTVGANNQTNCASSDDDLSLLNNPLVKPLAKVVMGDPFESQPDPSGETGETIGQFGIIAGAVGSRALVKSKKKKDKAIMTEAKVKKQEAKERQKKAKESQNNEAKTEDEFDVDAVIADLNPEVRGEIKVVETSFFGRIVDGVSSGIKGLAAGVVNLAKDAHQLATDSEFAKDFIDGVKKDFKGVPKDIINGAKNVVDMVEEGARLASDPQFYKDFAKGSAEDIVKGSDYIVNKMDADDIKSVGKKAAEVVGNAAEYMYENPVETMKMFTPIGDIEDGLDPNKSLSERFTSMGTALLDAATTLMSGGATKGAKVAAKIVQTKKVDAAKDAQKAADLGSGLDTADDVKKFGKVEQGPVVHSTKGASEVKKIPEVIEDRPKLTKENAEQRKEAWNQHKIESEKLVQKVGEALDSGDPKAIGAQMIASRRNKTAMNRMNSKLNNDQKKAYQKHTDELHAKVDGDVRAYAQKRFDLGEMEGPFLTSTGKVWRNPKTGAEFRTVESTNPVGTIKIGSDRDITYRVVKPDKNGKRLLSDIDHREVRPTYDKSYHKHSKAKEHGYDEDPATFAKNQDQMVTDAKHSEAYGRSQKEGQAILEGKISDDSELLGDTMAYKGNHWNNKGSTGGGLEDNTFEGIRNMSKQQATRFQPLADELRRINPNHRLLKDSSYSKLNSNKYPILDEMKKLETNPYGADVKSPVEIEMMIKDAGFANINEFNNMLADRTKMFERAVRFHRGGL